jgi:putative Ca2+/H+ antiporter (TMEM165/GDT1 family)
MLGEFVEAFVLVFFAEVGDKTQLMLMTLAAKYTVIQMLLGILLGVTINHGAAVIIGCCLSNVIEGGLLQLFAGFIFIVFGILTILYDEDEKEAKSFRLGPMLTTALTFLLGEMGDKTQLAAMTLAMEAQYPYMVLGGSVSGMLAIGFVGIIIGSTLTKFVPSNIIKIISGLIFILFGLMRFIE